MRFNPKLILSYLIQGVLNIPNCTDAYIPKHAQMSMLQNIRLAETVAQGAFFSKNTKRRKKIINKYINLGFTPAKLRDAVFCTYFFIYVI